MKEVVFLRHLSMLFRKPPEVDEETQARLRIESHAGWFCVTHGSCQGLRPLVHTLPWAC